MWIPYHLLSIFAAAQYTTKDPAMIPVNQPIDTVYCKYGDASYTVPAHYVRESHLKAMTMVYQDPSAKGYPSIIQPGRVEDTPKWNTVMRQYPVNVPGGPKLNVSPFRVIFSEPEVAVAKDGSKVALSSFWNIVSVEGSSKAAVCDSMPVIF